MNDIEMKLPLRLMPRKFGAVLLGLFFMFFFVFSIFWTTMAAMGVMTGGMENEPFPGFRYAFPAFGLPFMAVGFCGFMFAVMKLLPGSPYYHVEISAQGLTSRRVWKRQSFAWPELSPFAISIKTKSTKGGKVTTYWVVALRAADESRLSVESERYNRSVLQIDTGEYCGGKAADAAPILVDWLNGIRAEAIDRPGRPVTIVAVPPDFRGAAREIASTTGPTRLATKSSVIER